MNATDIDWTFAPAAAIGIVVPFSDDGESRVIENAFYIRNDEGKWYYMFASELNKPVSERTWSRWGASEERRKFLWYDRAIWKPGYSIENTTHPVVTINQPKNLDDQICETLWGDEPLLEWQVARNRDGILVPGTQLCTKDGRRMGNAHIIATQNRDFGRVYECLTDAGNCMTLTAKEIRTAFYIGDYVNCVTDTLRKFDRNNHFETQHNYVRK